MKGERTLPNRRGRETTRECICASITERLRSGAYYLLCLDRVPVYDIAMIRDSGGKFFDAATIPR